MEENENIEEKTAVESKETEVVETVPQTENVTTENNKNDSKALSIAALVLGIVSLVGGKLGILALACGILAIIFGVKGQQRDGKKMAKAGMILGIISVSLYAVIFLFVTILGVGLGAAMFSAVM